MPVKATGNAPPLSAVTEHEVGFTWRAYPEEGMQRASHALESDGDVWVVDPVDAPDLDDRLAEMGTVAGVVTLLDRHKRDAAALARRHDVSVYLPRSMSGVGSDLDAPVAHVDGTLGETGFVVHELVDNAVWTEAALYREDDGTLVVPEAVGTAPHFRGGNERLGVHPMLRLTPPRRLNRLSPARILVGHGDPVVEDATAALSAALENSWRNAPAAYANALSSFVFG